MDKQRWQSLEAVNTESDILWIATARHRDVWLTVVEHWLAKQHSQALESLTLRLVGCTWRTLDVLETHGHLVGAPTRCPRGDFSINSKPAHQV